MHTVALVDNDSIFHFTATRLMERTKLAGKILHFVNGAEAIQFLKESASHADILPDFLLLDINMPVMDGWKFMEDFSQLKSSLTKKIKIYMVSSSVDNRDINRAKGFTDVVDFISKPVTLERLSDMLRSA